MIQNIENLAKAREWLNKVIPMVKYAYVEYPDGNGAISFVSNIIGGKVHSPKEIVDFPENSMCRRFASRLEPQEQLLVLTKCILPMLVESAIREGRRGVLTHHMPESPSSILNYIYWDETNEGFYVWKNIHDTLVADFQCIAAD